jgi:PAS domain S-box-containing protein
MISKQMKILAVEDDPDDRLLLREALNEGSRDTEIQLAFAGQLSEALQLAAAKAFDVILLDLGLPDSNGIETFLALQAGTPKTPIILLTGLNDEALGMKAVREGAQDYLIKGSVRGGDLFRAIRYAIGRKEVELLLKETNTQLQTLIQTIPDAVYVKDTESRHLIVNRAAEELLAMQAEDAKGRTNEELMPSDLLNECSASDEPTLRQGKTVRCEERFADREGRSMFLDTVKAPLRDDAGNIFGLVGVSRNITQRKLVEEELTRYREHLEDVVDARTEELKKANRQLQQEIAERKEMQDKLLRSEKRYRAIIEDQTELVSRFTPDGELTFVNEAYCRYFGETPDELVGRKYWHHLPEGEQSKLAAHIACLGPENPVAVIEHPVVSPTGEIRWQQWTDRVILDDGGNTVEIQAVGRDITERIRAEKALRESERYYRSLLYSMHEDILVVDREYRVTDVNKDYLPSIQRQREELIDSHCHEVSHGLEEPCGRHGQECIMCEVLEMGRPRFGRHKHVRADGGSVWLDIQYSPLRSEKGEITHVIQAARDVTHEIELQSQLRQAQKMEAIGTLAGGIAHDFNNILGIILGYSEMAIFDVGEKSPVYGQLKEIQTAGHRAKELVKQILAFSRKAEKGREPLRISLIVKEAVKLLKAALPSTLEIRQKIDISDGESTILADATQIHQVLMNLCTNAAHAMRDRGGILEVGLSAVELSREDRDRPFELDPGRYVKLTVSDTGHGIDPVTIERIFEPYFTTKGTGEGTGLGLSVVHGIVRSHGGAVIVSSEQGAGTTFDVYFPRLESEIAEERHVVSSLPLGSETVLYVDDEEVLVSVARTVLERLGYRVVFSTNGADALEIIRRRANDIDLVVTDQTMPGMTGLELAREILSIRPDMPVVLCTGFSEHATPEAAGAMGIRELLMKPFEMRELAGVIRRLLDEDSGGRPRPKDS